MFGTAVIVFREVFEAGLVIGIVAAALGHAPKAMQYIWGGVLAGVAGSLLVALLASQISNLFEGYGQELFNAAILCLAVLMLAWHTLWMARSGRQMDGRDARDGNARNADRGAIRSNRRRSRQLHGLHGRAGEEPADQARHDGAPVPGRPFRVCLPVEARILARRALARRRKFDVTLSPRRPRACWATRRAATFGGRHWPAAMLA